MGGAIANSLFHVRCAAHLMELICVGTVIPGSCQGSYSNSCLDWNMSLDWNLRLDWKMRLDWNMLWTGTCVLTGTRVLSGTCVWSGTCASTGTWFWTGTCVWTGICVWTGTCASADVPILAYHVVFCACGASSGWCIAPAARP